MFDSNLSPWIERLLAVVSGAIVAFILSLKEGWLRALTTAVVAVPISWYSGPELVKFLPSLSPGFISFVLGVFGAKVAGSLYDAVSSGHLTAMLLEWLRLFLKLPPKQPPQDQG